VTRHYVDITGISDQELEMLGYYLASNNGTWALYTNKGDAFIVHLTGRKRCIFIEDMSDALILKGRNSLPAPPKPAG
jgi:hypothetical protein